MKGKPTPPTSEEITRRLRIVSELRNLCLSLGRAKRAGAGGGVIPTPRSVVKRP